MNARHDLSTKELLSVPTVVELCHIGDADFRAFLLSLLLIRVYEHFSRLGPAKDLRNLLVIDEAHSVLEELPRVVDTEMAAASRRKAVEQLIDLIAEARSPGLGTIIADQNATRLSRERPEDMLHQNRAPTDKCRGSSSSCTRNRLQS